MKKKYLIASVSAVLIATGILYFMSGRKKQNAMETDSDSQAASERKIRRIMRQSKQHNTSGLQENA